MTASGAQHIHWLHRITVIAGLAAVAVVVLAAEKLREPSDGVRRGARLLLALYVAQIAIGALNVWTRFSDAALVAHLAVGSAIWASMVLLVVAGRFRRELPAREPSLAPARGETSGARA